MVSELVLSEIEGVEPSKILSLPKDNFQPRKRGRLLFKTCPQVDRILNTA